MSHITKLLLFIVLFQIFSSIGILMEIRKIQQTKDVHWIIPKESDCAVKMFFLRNKAGDLKPSSRMVCHWENK